MRHRTFVAGALLAGVVLLGPAEVAGAATGPTTPAVTPADTSQANLVASEDARINNIRSLGALARAKGSTLIDAPYRLRTGDSYTLVLTPRSAPYTVNDLLQLAPDTFTQEAGGAYLLSESLFVDQGAELQLLATSAPIRLRLQSNPSGFVSIISFGGALDFEGTSADPISITSYDAMTGLPDTSVADGRAYIRSIGGTVAFDYVDTSDLGFWSGRTGGVAITGNDRPHLGLLGVSSTSTQTYGKNRHLGHYSLTKGAASPAASPPVTAAGRPTTPAGNGAIQPAGRVNPREQPTSVNSSFQYVAGHVQHSRFDGNAFGLFLSGAKDFVVTDSTFTDNLYAGLVVHRYVTGALLQRDAASHNGADGFDVTRAASGVQMIEDTSDHNRGIGFSINGNPLATTQSAAGMPLTAYGNHMIANSTATDNAKAGIEVIGAMNTTVQSTEVDGSPMGIVVRGAATDIKLLSNRINHIAKHGLSIRDGVSGAVLTGNIVDNSATGIYVRNSVATISNNSIHGGQTHAISLVGVVGHTSVVDNEMSGIGAGPVDTFRVRHSAVSISGNDTSRWVDLRTWTRHIKQILLSPLTLLWMAILLLIAFTALRGRKQPAPGHPYANSRPLAADILGPAASGPWSAPGTPVPGDLWVPQVMAVRPAATDPYRPTAVTARLASEV